MALAAQAFRQVPSLRSKIARESGSESEMAILKRDVSPTSVGSGGLSRLPRLLEPGQEEKKQEPVPIELIKRLTSQQSRREFQQDSRGAACHRDFKGGHSSVRPVPGMKHQLVKEYPEDLDHLGYWLRENSILKYLNGSPGIVASYSWGEQITIERYPMNLYRWLRSKPHLNWEMKERIFRRLVLSLWQIHRKGLIHRDLKTPNVVLDPDNPDELVIIDLGTVRSHLYPTEWMINNKKMIKKIGYTGVVTTLPMEAPELNDHFGNLSKSFYNGKIDVWALGLIILELFFDYTPTWSVRSHSDLFRKISQEFSRHKVLDLYHHTNLALEYTPLRFQKFSRLFPSNMSLDLQFFLNGMLQINPEHRLSLERIVTHPYFKEKIGHVPVIKSRLEIIRERADDFPSSKLSTVSPKDRMLNCFIVARFIDAMGLAESYLFPTVLQYERLIGEKKLSLMQDIEKETIFYSLLTLNLIFRENLDSSDLKLREHPTLSEEESYNLSRNLAILLEFELLKPTLEDYLMAAIVDFKLPMLRYQNLIEILIRIFSLACEQEDEVIIMNLIHYVFPSLQEKTDWGKGKIDEKLQQQIREIVRIEEITL